MLQLTTGPLSLVHTRLLAADAVLVFLFLARIENHHWQSHTRPPGALRLFTHDFPVGV